MPSGPASVRTGWSPPVGQARMHWPHLTHLARNLSSARAPGGRMSLSEARLRDGVRRKKGAATRPKKVVTRSLRRERLTFETLVSFSTRADRGKPIAAVGEIEGQFIQESA